MIIVKVDKSFFRPAEVDTLLGVATKAQNKLGWKPKIKFSSLVTEMMEEDLLLAKRDKLIKQEGFKLYDRFE